MQADIWRMGASDLAEAIRRKKASSREVVEAHLARIEAVNPAVNAVTVVLADAALTAADAADRAVAAGGDLAPLARRPDDGQGEHRRGRLRHDAGAGGAEGRRAARRCAASAR